MPQLLFFRLFCSARPESSPPHHFGRVKQMGRRIRATPSHTRVDFYRKHKRVPCSAQTDTDVYTKQHDSKSTVLSDLTFSNSSSSVSINRLLYCPRQAADCIVEVANPHICST
jgi:hypothetical protein